MVVGCDPICCQRVVARMPPTCLERGGGSPTHLGREGGGGRYNHVCCGGQECLLLTWRAEGVVLLVWGGEVMVAGCDPIYCQRVVVRTPPTHLWRGGGGGGYNCVRCGG